MSKWVGLVIIILVLAGGVFLLQGGGVLKKESHVVRLTNVSDYTIAPGAYAIHNPAGYSMNLYGTIAPKAYESLAEVGDPTETLALLAVNQDVYVSGQTSAAPILPGESVEIMIDTKMLKEYEDAHFSFMAMIVESNDGLVWLNGLPLFKKGEDDMLVPHLTPSGTPYVSEIMDLGTEENSPVGSGFEGGQPDPSRGAENIDNGVATNDQAGWHTQFRRANNPNQFERIVEVLFVSKTEE